MKVICICTCQKDRKTVYKVGKTYDISEEMYIKNTAFFKIAERKNKKTEKGADE